MRAASAQAPQDPKILFVVLCVAFLVPGTSGFKKTKNGKINGLKTG
jgi:hypothetical protein